MKSIGHDYPKHLPAGVPCRQPTCQRWLTAQRGLPRRRSPLRPFPLPGDCHVAVAPRNDKLLGRVRRFIRFSIIKPRVHPYRIVIASEGVAISWKRNAAHEPAPAHLPAGVPCRQPTCQRWLTAQRGSPRRRSPLRPFPLPGDCHVAVAPRNDKLLGRVRRFVGIAIFKTARTRYVAGRGVPPYRRLRRESVLRKQN